METIELNPDGTYPNRQQREMSASYTCTTSTNNGFIPNPPKKKTWKDYREDLFAFYLLMAAAVGTGKIIVWIADGIIMLVKFVL